MTSQPNREEPETRATREEQSRYAQESPETDEKPKSREYI